jgi:hypothetical protein
VLVSSHILTELEEIADGVRVVSFAPLGSHLESAYLALSQERLLVDWVAVIAVFAALLQMALVVSGIEPGVPLFGGLMMFVLALVLVVSPAQIALGKLVAADAAPNLPPSRRTRGDRFDPLGSIGRQVREIRHGSYSEDGAAVWPYGLTFNLLLGAGGILVTTRRLRAPAKDLAEGVRVA